jgi:hypothetical protein
VDSPCFYFSSCIFFSFVTQLIYLRNHHPLLQMLLRSFFARPTATHQPITLVYLFWSRHETFHPSSPPPSILSPQKSSSLRGPFYGSIVFFMNFFERRCFWFKFVSSITNFFKGMCLCYYHNPSLRFVTASRAYKGVNQKRNPRVTFHVSESV